MMNRDFYFFGIFFLGLYVVAALFQSIIFFQIGYQIYNLQSFSNWFLVVVGTSLVGLVFMLKYFHHKGYRLVFITGAIFVIASLYQNTIIYLLLLLFREVESYYLTALILSLSAAFLYAISLVFSKAGREPWLKVLGVFMIILVGISVYLLILSRNVPSGQPPTSIVTQLNQWVALANCLMPVPVIVLFYRELKPLKTSDEVNRSNQYTGLMYALGGIAAFMTFVLGIRIGTQSYWSTHVSASTKAMSEPFESRSYVNQKGDILLYRLMEPQDYNPNQQYPMVVCLHGGAGWGTDNYRNIEGSLFARMLSEPENRKKYPSFLFVPQCPPGSSWGGYLNLPTVDSLVFETISVLEDEFAIDEERLYVVGHSLGGYGAWHFAGTRPDKFAAAIPVAGEGNPALASNIRDVATWAFHGANDRNVPVSGSRDMIDAIEQAGGNPRYTESPNGGHSWEIVTETPRVLDWLFAQQRN
ncbi:MAG: prolyl oligopeptidase family serine peptidase [Bacteroidota bacterium]